MTKVTFFDEFDAQLWGDELPQVPGLNDVVTIYPDEVPEGTVVDGTPWIVRGVQWLVGLYENPQELACIVILAPISWKPESSGVYGAVLPMLKNVEKMS